MERTDKLYNILKVLNREGYDNARWGVLDLPRDTPSRSLFADSTGTVVPQGRYFWLWLQSEDDFPDDLAADITIAVENGTNSIAKLYKI